MTTLTRPKPMDSPVHPLAEPDHWTLPGIVTGASRAKPASAAHGVLAHDSLAHDSLAAVGHGLGWLARILVAQPVRRWLERERLVRELSLLSERELADLGITSSDIPYVAAGGFQDAEEERHVAPHPAHCGAANANTRPQKAA